MLLEIEKGNSTVPQDPGVTQKAHRQVSSGQTAWSLSFVFPTPSLHQCDHTKKGEKSQMVSVYMESRPDKAIVS